MSIEKKTLLSFSPTAKDAASGLTKGGFYDEIQGRDPVLAGKIKAEVEQVLAERFGAAPMIAPMSAVISEAWK